MIKAKQLMVDSLLQKSDEADVIVKVESFFLMDGGWFIEWIKLSGEGLIEGCDLIHEFNPIPLTPEWLERCGIIEKGSSLPRELRFAGEGNFTVEAVDEGKLKYYLPFNKRIEVKFVHQLQNLYFALTGEELNVKL